jgi:hypothetical protein
MTSHPDSHWPSWVQYAACLEIGVDAFYPEDANSDWETPRRVCLTRCTVRLLCLDRVMSMEQGKDHKTRCGVVAGLSPMERKAHEPVWLAQQEDDAA